MLAAVPALLAARPDEPSPPVVVADGVFDAGSPTRGLAEVPGAETFTIAAATDAGDKFRNGVQVLPFKGRLYAQWQSTPRDEDTADGRVVWSRSDDGQRWDEPRVLVEPPGEGLMRSGAGFWSDGQTLVAYIEKLDSWYPGKVKITEARTTRDGVTWSAVRTVADGFVTHENVDALPGGRLVTAVQAHLPGQTRLFGVPAYTDQRDGLGGWTLAAMPQPPTTHPQYGRGIEPTWFRRPDGTLVMLFRDMNKSGRLLACEGSPDATTWTMPVETNFPDSNSMPCAGNLPDGTAYVINNPTPNGPRVPLTIALSDDGRTFRRAFLVRGKAPARRYDGKYKSQGYSYPGAAVWGDSLYVCYAMNKEDAQVTRLPLAALASKR